MSTFGFQYNFTLVFPNILTSPHLETICYIACDDDVDDKPTNITTTSTNNNNNNNKIQTLRASGTTPLRKKLFAMQAYSYHNPTLTSRL